MHQPSKRYLDVPPRVHCQKHEFQDAYQCTLPLSQVINYPAGYLPRLPHARFTILPKHHPLTVWFDNTWYQTSLHSATIREHVLSTSMVPKYESWEVITKKKKKRNFVALSSLNLLSGETLLIASKCKLRWTLDFCHPY